MLLGIIVYIIGMIITGFATGYIILWEYSKKTLDENDAELIGAVAVCWPLVMPIATPIIVGRVTGKMISAFLNKRAKKDA